MKYAVLEEARPPKTVYFIAIFAILESLLFKPYLSKHLQTSLTY